MNKVWESFLKLINETGGVYDNFATLLIKEAINALWEMIIRKHQIIDGDWMLLYVASDHKNLLYAAREDDYPIMMIMMTSR